MKKRMFVLPVLFVIMFFMSCSVEPVSPPTSNAECLIPSGEISANTTKEFDDSVLKKQSEAVYSLSLSNTCQKGSTWGVSDIGAKPCGGPAGYIAFLNLI